MTDEENPVLALLQAIRDEQQAASAKLSRLDTKVDVLTEGLADLRESVKNLEDKVELLQGSIIRLDGNGVEAMAILRMLERYDRRIKVLEERTKQ